MPIITLTISINVPEGVTVDVTPEITSTPKTATMPTIMFSEEPEYPEWVSADRTRWSEDEDAVAKDPEYTDEDIAALTGRSPAAVHSYRLKRGYVVKSRDRVVDRTAERSMARWTTSEIEYLMANFEDDGAVWEAMSRQLGRSVAAIRRKHNYELQKAVEETAQ